MDQVIVRDPDSREGQSRATTQRTSDANGSDDIRIRMRVCVPGSTHPQQSTTVPRSADRVSGGTRGYESRARGNAMVAGKDGLNDIHAESMGPLLARPTVCDPSVNSACVPFQDGERTEWLFHTPRCSS